MQGKALEKELMNSKLILQMSSGVEWWVLGCSLCNKQIKMKSKQEQVMIMHHQPILMFDQFCSTEAPQN